MQSQSVTPSWRANRLEFIPISLFAVLMGVFQLGLTADTAARIWPFLAVMGDLVFGLGLGIFVMVGAIYLAKIIRHPAAVRAEWNHPVKIAFFATATIALLLCATALLTRAPQVALVLWLIAMLGQGALTLAVITSWISHRAFEMGHLTPAWFIPAVGNVIVPLGGTVLGYQEISWLFFSGGMVFWLVLLVLVMNRLMFHDPIPARLLPTLVILIAPPAVGFVAYVKLTGGIDPFARILLYSAYVFAGLVVLQVPKLLRLPFVLSFWALSFPVGALAVASMTYGQINATAAHQMIGAGVFVLLTLLVLGLLQRSLRAALRGEIGQPD